MRLVALIISNTLVSSLASGNSLWDIYCYRVVSRVRCHRSSRCRRLWLLARRVVSRCRPRSRYVTGRLPACTSRSQGSHGEVCKPFDDTLYLFQLLDCRPKLEDARIRRGDVSPNAPDSDARTENEHSNAAGRDCPSRVTKGNSIVPSMPISRSSIPGWTLEVRGEWSRPTLSLACWGSFSVRLRRGHRKFP